MKILRVLDDCILDTKSSKKELNIPEQRWAKLTVPNPIDIMIIISVRDGVLLILCENLDTFSFNFSIEELSAFSHLFILSDLPIPINIIDIHILATTISTKTIPPYSFWL